MTSQLKYRILSTAIGIAGACFSQDRLLAGPFSDWWAQHHGAAAPAYPVGSPVPVASGYGSYAYPYNAYTGYPNTSYSPVISLPQTVAGALPTGAYASQYYRAPTTYYRPVTSFDPVTGTNVTSLQPCSSYQYQAQRVPLLTPAWTNYPYGGYASAVPATRWPTVAQPNVASPAVGSAAGQSALSIASGFGTYANSPVVQPSTPALSAYPTAPMAHSLSNPLPVSQPVISGYGGIHYSPTPTASTVIASPNSVVPAATWSSPTMVAPAYPSQTFPYATATPAPSSIVPSPSTLVMPPAIPSSSVPAPAPVTTWSPMPGSMGLTTIPPAPSTTLAVPSLPATETFPSTSVPPSSPVFPSILPPTSANGTGFDAESQTTPRLMTPSDSSSLMKPPTDSPEQPRFQLRSVERQPSTNDAEPSQPKWPPSQAPTNPPASSTGPQLQPLPSNGSDSNSSTWKQDFDLKLNTESLRPIPAPPDFDATPEWRSPLMNAHDQTAKQRKVEEFGKFF
jgi:hypothetical protein